MTHAPADKIRIDKVIRFVRMASQELDSLLHEGEMPEDHPVRETLYRAEGRLADALIELERSR